MAKAAGVAARGATQRCFQGGTGALCSRRSPHVRRGIMVRFSSLGVLLFIALWQGASAGGFFPLSELEETATMALPWEVRLADQQRLRRQSIRTLDFHNRGTVLAPNEDSVNELRIVAAATDLDTILYTPDMLEHLWQTLPPTPLTDVLDGVASDEIPDAQHDLSPRTLEQMVILGTRVRGEVPSHLRQTESGSSGVLLSPTPQ
eukprot:1481235-Amphidinium_carterae.1